MLISSPQQITIEKILSTLQKCQVFLINYFLVFITNILPINIKHAKRKETYMDAATDDSTSRKVFA